MRVVIVGAGVMGSMHGRALRARRDVDVVQVIDPDVERAKVLADLMGARPSSSIDDLDEADGVIVASSTGAHHEVVSALLARSHPPALLVEKPLAGSVTQAAELVALARGHEHRVLVGHVERFNPAVRELLSWRDAAPVHVEMRRVGPGSPRVDVDVVRDLMIHDLDILIQLLGRDFVRVAAVLQGETPRGADLAAVVLQSTQGVTATVTASRVAQLKERTVTLTCEGVQVVADLVRQQVTIHRTLHQEFSDEGGARYRQSGVVEIPYLAHGEPLQLEHQNFVDVILGAALPEVSVRDAAAGLELCERVLAAGRWSRSPRSDPGG